jgi:hypothetical protein
VTMGYCLWCVRSLQNGVHMRLLPSTKMGSLRFFYQVPKWGPYASSTKYPNGSLRFFYQVPKWGPYASSTKYQNGAHTLLLSSTKMGSIRFFYQVPKWGPYASSTKRQSGVPTLLLPSTKMGSTRFYSPLEKCASPQQAGRSCKLVIYKTNT